MENNYKFKLFKARELEEIMDAIESLRMANDLICKTIKINKNIDVVSFGDIFYNKFLEIINEMSKRGLPYDNAVIGGAIFQHFVSIASKVMETIDLYLHSKNEPNDSFENKLETYNKLCDELLNFNLDKDIDVAINNYLDSLQDEIDQYALNVLIKTCNEELKTLNIDKTILNRENSKKVTDLEVLEKYRKDLNSMFGFFVDYKISVEKYEHGKVVLCPLNIYIHNKFGEIYKYFKERNISFSDSALCEMVFNYFVVRCQDAKDEINMYYEKNKSFVSVLVHELKNKTIGMEHIKNYNEICNEILNFTIEKDMVKALNVMVEYFETMPEYSELFNEQIKKCNKELEKLGIDYTVDNINYDKENPLENKKNILLSLRKKLTGFIDSTKKEKEEKKLILKK